MLFVLFTALFPWRRANRTRAASWKLADVFVCLELLKQQSFHFDCFHRYLDDLLCVAMETSRNFILTVPVYEQFESKTIRHAFHSPFSSDGLLMFLKFFSI